MRPAARAAPTSAAAWKGGSFGVPSPSSRSPFAAFGSPSAFVHWKTPVEGDQDEGLERAHLLVRRHDLRHPGPEGRQAGVEEALDGGEALVVGDARLAELDGERFERAAERIGERGDRFGVEDLRLERGEGADQAAERIGRDRREPARGDDGLRLGEEGGKALREPLDQVVEGPFGVLFRLARDLRAGGELDAEGGGLLDEGLGDGGKSGEGRLGEVALAGERFGGAIDDRALEVADLREKPGHLPDGRPGVVQRPGDRLGRIGPGDRGHQLRIAGDEAPLVPEGDVPHAQVRGRLLQPAAGERRRAEGVEGVAEPVAQVVRPDAAVSGGLDGLVERDHGRPVDEGGETGVRRDRVHAELGARLVDQRPLQDGDVVREGLRGVREQRGLQGGVPGGVRDGGRRRRRRLRVAAPGPLDRKEEDRVLEARDEIGEADGRQQIDRLAARKLPGDVEPLVGGRIGIGGERLAGRRELLARHLGHPLGVLPEDPVEVARDEALEEQDVVVGGDRAGPVEGVVHRVAAVRAVGALRVGEAGVPLGGRADPRGAGMVVDRVGVSVEDLAHLLARERLHAALAEVAVDGLARVGREAELPADAGDLVGADAARGERLDEGGLDGHHLLVGERDHVLAEAGDVVVHLAEGVPAGDADLAGVVRAGRDLLELAERDVDVGEVDGHGGDSSDE